MAILILADTHLTAPRAESLIELLGGHLDQADAILHAGDITCLAVLELLERFAPVTAVRGNNDVGLELPEKVSVEIDGVAIAMVHDSGAARGRDARLAEMFPAADVVVFGHSHLPWNECVTVGSRTQVHFNPGSPTQRRRAPTRTVGWIEVDDDGEIRGRHDDL